MRVAPVDPDFQGEQRAASWRATTGRWSKNFFCSLTVANGQPQRLLLVQRLHKARCYSSITCNFGRKYARAGRAQRQVYLPPGSYGADSAAARGQPIFTLLKVKARAAFASGSSEWSSTF